MKENPAFFAVIPATVLYDKTLSPAAKILYAQISGLCNKKGFCWAANSYFAKLHDVSDRSIQNWLAELKDKGYIKIEFEYIPETKHIQSRKITLALSMPEEPPAPQEPPAPPMADAASETEGGEKFFRGGEKIFTTPLKNSS